MKTVLAPGAPWPVYEPQAPKAKRKPAKKAPKPSEIDRKFAEWLSRSIPTKVGTTPKLQKSNKYK